MNTCMEVKPNKNIVTVDDCTCSHQILAPGWPHLWVDPNNIPRVLGFLGRWAVTRRDSGVVEFLPQNSCGYWFLVLLHEQPIKQIIFFALPESLPAIRMPEDSRYMIGVDPYIQNIRLLYKLKPRAVYLNSQTLPMYDMSLHSILS